MKHILIVFILLFLCSFTYYQFYKLKNGKYLVVIKNRNLTHNKDNTLSAYITYDTFSIKIKDTLYIKNYENGDTLSGSIKYVSENVLIMRDYRVNIDTTEVGKLLLKSFGEPCIEFIDKHNDTIFFRTRHLFNLHVTINEGKFIKQKN